FASLQHALSAAAFRDMRNVELKNQRHAELKRVVYGLSLYVDHVAQGNAAIILAAGFLPSKDSTRIGPPPTPTNFRVNLLHPNSQIVELHVEAWEPIRVYQVESRKVGHTGDWQRMLCSKSVCVLEGLEMLKEYEFRVAYIGTDPPITYSDTIRSHVL